MQAFKKYSKLFYTATLYSSNLTSETLTDSVFNSQPNTISRLQLPLHQ